MQQTTHASKHKPTGPLSDAGPYEYDLPAARGGAGQPAPVKRPSWKDGGLSWGGTLAILFASMGSSALHDWSGLPRPHCYAIVYCVVGVFLYWDTPRPRQGFLRWTLKAVGIALNSFVALVTVPQSLVGLLPNFWAFALPVFTLVLVFHWVPPLLPNKSRTFPLWQWLLWAAGFAALWGWFGPGVVK